MLSNLKAKIVARIFPCEKILNNLFQQHAEVSAANREAHERFRLAFAGRSCAMPRVNR